MEDLTRIYNDAKKTVDEGLGVASTTARAAVAAAKETYNTAESVVTDVATQIAGQLCETKKTVQQLEDEAFSCAKQGILLANEYPTATYTLLATGALLALPGTRRLLYRATLGRFRNEEAIAKSAEEQLKRVSTTLEAAGKEVEALEAKMVLAEEEYKRGVASLREARSEMQRLASTVHKNEKLAGELVTTLREVRSVPNVMHLRAEAASKKAALKQHRALLEKYVWRIAKRDV